MFVDIILTGLVVGLFFAAFLVPVFVVITVGAWIVTRVDRTDATDKNGGQK